jgi:hypothetical protein
MTTSIVYYDDTDQGGGDLSTGCWRILDSMLTDCKVFSLADLNGWLKQHNAITRVDGDTIYVIDFETEEDLVVFKLKFGV